MTFLSFCISKTLLPTVAHHKLPLLSFLICIIAEESSSLFSVLKAEMVSFIICANPEPVAK